MDKPTNPRSTHEPQRKCERRTRSKITEKFLNPFRDRMMEMIVVLRRIAIQTYYYY